MNVSRSELLSQLICSIRHLPPGPCTVYWELSLMPGEMQIQWTGMALPDGIEKKNGMDPIRQSELFFRALFADSLDGVLLVNEMGIISFSSASVVNILGYEQKDLIGQKLF